MFQPSQLVTTQPESCIQVASSYNHPFKNPRTVHGFIVPIHPVSTELDTKPPSFCCHPPSGWLARPNHWHRSHHAIYIYVHWTWYVKSCIYMIYIYIYDTYIICIYIQTHGFFLQLQFFKTKKASQISANLIPPIVDSVRRLGHLWSGVFHQQRLPDWTFGRRSHSQWLCSTLSRSWPYQCPWSDPWWWPCLEGVKVKGVRRRCGSRRCSSWDEKGIPEKMADGSMFFFQHFETSV